MEPEQNETGNQGQSQQQQQLNQLLSDGSFCGEAADSHAGENDNTSRTPSPVHRIIDEDSYFSDMIQGQGKNNGGGSKVMPLPTKTQPPNGCGGSAGLPQEDGFQKLPLEVPNSVRWPFSSPRSPIFSLLLLAFFLPPFTFLSLRSFTFLPPVRLTSPSVVSFYILLFSLVLAPKFFASPISFSYSLASTVLHSCILFFLALLLLPPPPPRHVPERCPHNCLIARGA
jgi:hypothetical protein